jgi:lipopolysaccharide transport system permease protein
MGPARNSTTQHADGTTDSLPLAIYVPSPQNGNALRKMLSDLLDSRELAWRLFIRDISAAYRQSMLGYLWAFVPPAVSTLTFVALNSQGILSVADPGIPYPVFVLTGTILWQLFIEVLGSPLKAAQRSRSMLTKINFPREALILSGVAESLFNFLVRVVILFPVFILYDLSVSASVAFAPIAILALALVGLTFGVLITPLGLLYDDVSRAVVLFSGLWMLLTPVVYPPPPSGLGAALAAWNPVSPVLLTARQLLTAQPLTHPGEFVVTSLLALGLLFFAWAAFRLSMPILIERLGD